MSAAFLPSPVASSMQHCYRPSHSIQSVAPRRQRAWRRQGESVRLTKALGDVGPFLVSLFGKIGASMEGNHQARPLRVLPSEEGT